MSKLLIENQPCDKVLFPGTKMLPEDEREDEREDTNFYGHFKFAERYDMSVVEGVFRWAFSEFENNVKCLAELANVLINLCKENEELCRWNVADFYGRAFLKCRDFVLEGYNFTAKEKSFFLRVID